VNDSKATNVAAALRAMAAFDVPLHVILGGLGRVSATVVGGLAFGLVEAFGQSIPGSGSVFANAIAFGLMVLVLVTRPQGLMGRLR